MANLFDDVPARADGEVFTELLELLSNLGDAGIRRQRFELAI
jgi:hypothetical protein